MSTPAWKSIGGTLCNQIDEGVRLWFYPTCPAGSVRVAGRAAASAATARTPPLSAGAAARRNSSPSACAARARMYGRSWYRSRVVSASTCAHRVALPVDQSYRVDHIEHDSLMQDCNSPPCFADEADD